MEDGKRGLQSSVLGALVSAFPHAVELVDHWTDRNPHDFNLCEALK